MIDTDEHLRRLVETVLLIAAEGTEQLSIFPSFVAKADEIALTFDDSFAQAPQLYDKGRINAEQLKLLHAINKRLDVMSEKTKASLWTEGALLSDPAWETLRQHAKDLLQSLGVTLRKPVLNWLRFVQ